jgi:toxin CptA
LVIWLFTLLDELWGLILYLRATGGAPTLRQLRYLDWSYRLGLAFSVAALLEIGYRRYRDRADLRTLLKAT